MTPYHRCGHASRWRALGELLLALFFALLLMGIFGVAVAAIWHVKRSAQLPKDVHTFELFGAIAMQGPATLLAALATGRRPRSLWSVAGRIRWRWLATCLLAALCVRAISPLLIALDLALGHKTFAGLETYAWQLALVLALVPLQALAEELFFRGTVLQTVGTFARSPWPAIVISAALFTLAHGLRPEMALAMAPVGLCAGWLAVRTGGLEAGIGYHVVLNVIGMATQLAIAGGDQKGVNEHVHWLGAAFSAAFAIVYTIVVARLAQRLPAVPDQVEQHAAERGLSVEHADHGGDAEPLPPQE